MEGEPEERRRILGFPAGPDPYRRSGAETRRVLGMPADWIGPVDVAWFRALARPVRTWRRWRRRRRFGPFVDGDEGTGEKDGGTGES